LKDAKKELAKGTKQLNINKVEVSLSYFETR